MRENKTFTKSWIILIAGLVSIFIGFAISIQFELTLYLLLLITVIAIHFVAPRYTIAPFLLVSFYVPAYTKVDVAAILFFLSATIYFINGKRWDLIQKNPVISPLTVLAIFVAISTAFGLLMGKNLIQDIYKDGRIFLYWLFLIPLLAWTPRTHSIRWLANNMLFIGVCVCLLAIVQGTFAVRLVDTGLVADLDTMNMEAMSTVRVQIPGFMFAMFALSYVTALLLGRAWSALPLVLLFCILALGIIFNFGRALWFWTFVSLLIVSVQYGARGLGRFLAWVAAPAILGVAMLAAVKPNMLETIGTRITSVVDEGGVGSSFGWRTLENQEGIKALKSSYFLGVGMGGKYRRFNELLINFPDHTIYTHNGILYIALKLSVFGLFAYIFLVKRTTTTLLRYKPESTEANAVRIASIAFTFAFIGINTTEPEVMSHYGLLPLVFISAICIFIENRTKIINTAPH